jgi:hypothetical protein
MKGSTKNYLLAAIVLLLCAVMLIWYIRYPRQQYNKLNTLSQIIFQPPQGVNPCSATCSSGQVCISGLCMVPAPVFTFIFSEPIDEKIVAGSTAFLKSFVSSSGAEDFVTALLKGGGVPFTPTYIAPATITSNAMPTGITQTTPMTISGSGAMWFTIPA